MTKRNSGHRTFTRSTGAKSGSETYLIAGLVVFALYCLAGWYNTLSFVTTCLVLQLTAMSPFDAAIFYHFITSQKFGPAVRYLSQAGTDSRHLNDLSSCSRLCAMLRLASWRLLGPMGSLHRLCKAIKHTSAGDCENLTTTILSGSLPPSLPRSAIVVFLHDSRGLLLHPPYRTGEFVWPIYTKHGRGA